MIANALPITDAVPFTAHIHGTADAPKRRSTICKPTRNISPIGMPCKKRSEAAIPCLDRGLRVVQRRKQRWYDTENQHDRHSA